VLFEVNITLQGLSVVIIRYLLKLWMFVWVRLCAVVVMVGLSGKGYDVMVYCEGAISTICYNMRAN
jgi:hypothetical protein